MHGELRVGGAAVLLSDGQCTGQPKFEGFSLSLTVANEAEAGRRSGALAEGGQVEMPLAKTFFSPRFGHARRPVRRAVDGLRRAAQAGLTPRAPAGGSCHVIRDK